MRHNDSQEKGKPTDLSDQVLLLAQSDAALNHPNPDRKDCPESSVLSALIDSGQLPDAELRDHLLHCSPCFLLFRRLRHEASQTYTHARTSLRRTKKGSRYILAAAIAASLVLTSIIFIYSSSPSDSRDVASVRENLQATTETESGREILSPKIDTPKEVIQEKPIAEKPNTSSIDRVVIEPKEALSRRGDSTEESSQEIPNKKLLLKIRLSADSPSGLYVISVLDEFGRNLLPKKRAVSRAGYVTSLLDLTNLSGSARICVGLAGEIPECSAVIFNK